MECIGCAACVDACDTVMDKLSRSRGLVRYDSMHGLKGKPTRWIRPRILLYTALLLLGAAGYVWREPIAAAIAHWTAPQPPVGRPPP